MSKSKERVKEGEKLSKKGTKHVLVGGKQLEAQVHTSLPPLVKGASRGHVRVSLEGGIVWEYTIGPPAPKLCVRLKWWGEKSSGTFFRVPVKMSSSHARDSTTLAYFPVCAGLTQLTAYFKDMGALVCDIGLGRLTDDSMLIGQAIIPSLVKLTPKSSIKGLFPIVTSNDVHLGHLQVHISIEMTKQTAHQPVVAPPPKIAHKNEESSLQPPEFIVGPGGGWNTRQSTSISSPQRGKQSEAAGMLKKKTIGEVHIQQQGEVHLSPTDDGVSKQLVSMGTQQMGVISELIERGQRLRNEMVRSVANVYESKSELKDGTTEKTRSVGGDSLTLLSAELAHQVQLSNQGESHDLDLDCAYVEVSSSEGEGLDEGGMSTCESDYEDTLLSAMLLSEQPHPQPHYKVGDESSTMVRTHPPSHNHPSILARPQQTETEDHRKEHDVTPLVPKETTTTSHDSASVVSSALSHRDGMKTESISTLSSHFSGRSLESTIVSSVGMEKLTHLGRVTTARVSVDALELDTSVVDDILTSSQRRKNKRNSKAERRMVQPQVGSCTSATYFVEYQFPAMVHQRQHHDRCTKASGRHHPISHEVMRIASKKMKDGVVNFSHCSVFPVVFDSSVVQQWWSNILVFRVYCRPADERLPFLVGKAVVPLRKWLTSSSLVCQCQLEVKTSSITDAVSGVSGDDPTFGTLSVSLALVEGSGGKKQHHTQSTKSHFKMTESLNKRNDNHQDRVEVVEDMKQEDSSVDGLQSGPVHFKEVALKSKADISEKKHPTSLQLLLLVPEATDVRLARNSISDEHVTSGVPNCYFICKLFCASPHPSTPVQWATTNPQFAFKQIHYLYLTPSLMDKLCNNFTVIEVWHKTPGTNTEDELVGLVKLSLHQFFLAYSDEQSAEMFRQAELPVIAVDSYCPIVNPFTGTGSGHLAVLLALGTAKQVSHLQQQVASGSYSLQRPYQLSQPPPARRTEAATEPDAHKVDDRHIRHVFDLTVEGVRGLSVFDNTVWGEADCFVQYHFPTSSVSSDDETTSEISLSPYRTGTTLCVPNPSFSHKTQHTLLLLNDVPLQRELIASCGGSGMSGGISFELWRRFYYPNIRDQLIARTSLPLAKLCAMVSMQNKKTGVNMQCFSLQMKLVSGQHRVSGASSGGGVLDVTVEYRAVSSSDDGGPHFEQSYVTLSVGILRATGLKDAAELAVKDHPVPLGLASEVGVNCYITVSIPDIVKDKRTTRTVARSFAPEFSHFFDITLPLSLSVGGTKQPARKVPLAQCLAETSILVEVWHKLSRRSSTDVGGGCSSSAVFGRRLGPAISDVLLGYTEISLIQLLQKHSGISGWFPLQPPLDRSELSSSQPPRCKYTGGVELSISFTKEADQQTVLSGALNNGWKPPSSCVIDMQLITPNEFQTMSSFTGKHIRFELKVDNLWVPVRSVVVSTASQPTHHLCFVRYRFFDKKATVSSPKAVTYARDGRACYQLQHRSRVCTLGSPQLEWYLKEESLDVQLWATLFDGNKTSTRPHVKDSLLGSAYIPLSELLRIRENNASICGSYPLFKAGLDSLGNQAIQMSITCEILEGAATFTGEGTDSNTMEILDSESENEYIPAENEANHNMGLDKKVAESDELKRGASSEDKRSFEDMFAARIMIHQALHLPSVRCRTSLEESAPCAYVTLHPHPAVDKISTAVVSDSYRPSWEHQCITHIPNLYLQSQSPGLEMQVWSSRVSSSPSIESEKEREDIDIFIGCVNVDLSPLSYGLSQICGWYNIADFGGQSQGQLKVSVVPTQWISFPSPMLSCPIHLPSSIIGKSSFEVPKSSVLHHHSTEGKPHEPAQPASRTSSMLFQQLRENIKELDAVHQSLLTKLRETEQSSSWKTHFEQSHVPPLALKSSNTCTALHVGDPEVTDATPPSSLSHTHNQHIGTEDVVPNQHHETSEPVSLSTSPLSSEDNLSSVSSSRNVSPTSEESFTIQSISAGQLQNDHKESDGVDEGKFMSQDDGPPGSSNLNRTASITDVSVCSKLSEEQLPLSHHESGEMDSTAQLSESEADSEEHSSSEHVVHTSLPSQREDHCTQQQPSSNAEDHNHHQPSQATVDEHSPLSSHYDHSHSPGSTLNKNSEPLPTNIDPSKSSHQPTTSNSRHRRPPVVHLPDPHLPNFFMPPHELEQSMRRLRSSALSQPPPRMTQNERPAEQKEMPTSHNINGLQTLHEVKEFLESRRKTARDTPLVHDGSRGGKEEEYFTVETKRIATIFSS